ncbi:MAG TPA: LysM peptidoglycan-binding domain-containing protein [Anaerolineae bacterium]|nr:LysM peptidoglycan-binding domain-containing protein [Anaerolineae bacterium]
MTLVQNWREFILRNRYAVAAVAMIVVLGLGYLVFLGAAIIPGLQVRAELTAEAAQARQALVEAQRIEAETPDTLRTELAGAQARLSELVRAFLTETQAGQIINALYQYAAASGVTITDLQTQPDPAAETDAVHVATARLEVQGESRRLVEFVSRIQEDALYSVVVNNVNITEGPPGTNTLTLDVGLYTSPYATGEALTTGPLPPIATPPVNPLDPLVQRLADVWAAENWVEVINVIEQIRAIDPNYPELTEKLYAAHVNYGYQLLAQGNVDGARAEFNAALAVKPDGGEAIQALNELNPPPTPVPPTTILHTVQRGDTLFSLARRYGTSVQAIMAANGLTNFNIRVGQQLIIPLP